MAKSSLVKCMCGFFLVIFLSMCGRKQQHNNIFFYNESSGIASLDPAFAKNQSIMWPVHQLYNSLVQVDSNLLIQPMLAKQWQYSDDKKTITFLLRTDVFFQDDACFANARGRRFTAADVVYSFNRLIDATTASPGAWIFNGRVDTVQPFTALNDSIFVIKLLQPFQPLLGILSMQYASIIPREAVEKYGNDFRRHPVGTGPFQLVVWEEGQALVLKRNPNYFETDNNGQRLPYLDGIKISFLDSKASEFLQFKQGNLDFINDIDPSFKDELLSRTGELKKEWKSKIQLYKHSYLNVEYFGILMDTANEAIKGMPLRSLKIRKAINHAIDRKKLVFYLRNSIGTAAESGFIPAGMPSFNANAVKGYAYDPDYARQLLKEGNYDPSKTIILLTIPQYANLASYAANELRQCGIVVNVETVQKSVLLEMTSKNKAAFFRGSWIADYPDAENYLGVFYSKNPSPPNYTCYKNAAFDQLYEKALTVIDDSIRFRLYNQMDQMVMDDAPVVPLWYDMVLHLVQNNIRQWNANSLNMLELKTVKKIPNP